MFSADITWTPLAESDNGHKLASPWDHDNTPARGEENSLLKFDGLKTRLRWPRSKNSKRPTSTEQSIHSRKSSNPSLEQSGLIPYHGGGKNQTIGPMVNTSTNKGHSQEWYNPTAGDLPRNELFELPASVHGTPKEHILEHRPPAYVSDSSLQNERILYGQHSRMLSDPMPGVGKYPSSQPSVREAGVYIPDPIIDERVNEGLQKSKETSHSVLQKPEAGLETPYTYFYNFIRRMPLASPQTMYHRLIEEWAETLDEECTWEVQIEKRLWTQAAFNQLLTKINPENDESRLESHCLPPDIHHGSRILEFGSSLPEVHYLAATQPTSKIAWATITPKTRFSLPPPPNVDFIELSIDNPIVLPLADCNFDRIRAYSLPSTFPASKIKSALEECYRLLVRGGTLEMRLIDPIPNPDAGLELRTWVDTHLMLELEKSFIGSRPSLFVPMLCSEIGFSIGKGINYGTSETGEVQKEIQLPIAVNSQEPTLQDRFYCEVGRRIYDDTWGRYVRSAFWENESILNECRERNIPFNYSLLYAVKPNR